MKSGRSFLAIAFLLVSLLFSISVEAADAVVRATLSNGLRVVIVPNPLGPAVTIQVTYRVGAIDLPDGFPGMAPAGAYDVPSPCRAIVGPVFGDQRRSRRPYETPAHPRLPQGII